MENRPPVLVVVPQDREDAFINSEVLSSEFFVSPLPQPKTGPSTPSKEDSRKRVSSSTKDDTASVETASVASDIDSSCDGSVASQDSADSENDDEKDESMEFELELKKLKLLKQQKAQSHLKHPHLTHPFAQKHQPHHDPHRHPQRQSQLHPAQEKKLRGMAMLEQTDMIQEIHSMLSLLIDDRASESSRSSSDSSNKKSRSRNTTQSRSKRDIAILAKEKLSRFENDVHSLRQAESYDPRTPNQDSASHRTPANSFRPNIPAPPLWLDSAPRNNDQMVESKRLVKPDDISTRLMSDRHTSHQRSVEPQQPKRGKPVAASLHDNFSASFNFEKSPRVQKAMRYSSHSRTMPITPSMHERFSDSFDFQRSPQVQKALRLSSHRRKMPAPPNMHERFSKSFNLERAPMVKARSRRHSLQVPPLTLDERFSEHFELELEPEDEEEQSPETLPEPRTPEVKKGSVLSSLASRFTKSPVIQKALKLSTHNRTPRRTRKGSKSTRPSTPSECSSTQTLNKRSKKRAKALKPAPQLKVTSTKKEAPKPTEEQTKLEESTKPLVLEHSSAKSQTPTEEEKPARSVTPESSCHSRLMAASPGMEKSMIGEKLQRQIHKTQPDLAGRITGVLMEYNNADELVHMLEGPEEDMTERIVEVLEVLKGRGSKQRTIKA